MIKVEVSTVIRCPIEKVFAFVANFENLPKWEKDFVEVQEVKSAHALRAGVGATYNCLLTFPGPPTISEFEITECIPCQKITYQCEPGRPVVPNGSFLFEPVADGTKITSRWQPEIRNPFGWLEGISASSIEKHTLDHLNNLKRLLES
ncbi:MAG TPA: SRPBCC family protein [Anaerolineales bacterium]|nr:SRPBCC family protein [Anaerolineales bacterium]